MIFCLFCSLNLLIWVVLFAIHAGDKVLNPLVNRLEYDSVLAIAWFENSSMKLNQDKYHLIFSGHKHENLVDSFGQLII